MASGFVAHERKKNNGERSRRRFSIAAQTAEWDCGVREAFDSRREELRTRLVELYGEAYHVRDDSRLAFNYLTATGDGKDMKLDQVACELAQAQFLYACTDYKHMWDDARKVADRVRAQHPLVTWKRTWQLVREHMDPCIKLEAVRRAGRAVPPLRSDKSQEEAGTADA